MKTDGSASAPGAIPELDFTEPSAGSDRRAFMVRSAMATAIGLLGGQVNPLFAQAPANAQPVRLDPTLDVVKKSKGPVMILVDEFYKVGPGPSSSHTIGPMRITYDFYQRAIKLPQAQLDQATALKVHLYGSLSATGKGHGTERAALAGLIGYEPATIDPVAVLDKMQAEPNKTYPVKLGTKTINASLADIIYDATKGDFPHANTMTCMLMAGDKVLLEQEYYSVGGGFIEWKGYTPPKKNPPKYPYESMAEVLAFTKRDNISIAQLAMANETSISGRSEAEINAFLDKIIGAMRATVKTGLAAPTSTLPGPIKLKTKAGDVYRSAMAEQLPARKAIGVVSAAALAGSEENARGHLVITAPTGGSAGVMPAVLYSLDAPGAAGVRPEASRRPACRSCGRLSLQAPRDPRGCRRRLPGRDRRCLGDGRGDDRTGAGRASAGRCKWGGRRARASSWNDLRPRCRLRADPLHRALCVWSRQGLDRLPHRQG